MKKISMLLGLIVVALLVMGNGCKVETSTSFGLSIENSDFARIGPDGKLVHADNAVFQRGEKVNFILINVGEFEKGDDGLNWFDIDMEVRDPNGNVIFSPQDLLGEGGHVDIPNNIAASPYASFTTTAAMEPGDYRMKLTIYDKVSGASASKSATFTVE